MRFWGLHKIFIFHPILMGFFSLDFSQRELSELLQPIFSISYRFWDTRGQRDQKCDFGTYIKFLFFIQFWWNFFHWISLNESFQKCCSWFFLSLTVFKIQGAQKGILTYCQTYHFSQTHYCGKQVLEAYLFLLFCC